MTPNDFLNLCCQEFGRLEDPNAELPRPILEALAYIKKRRAEAEDVSYCLDDDLYILTPVFVREMKKLGFGKIMWNHRHAENFAMKARKHWVLDHEKRGWFMSLLYKYDPYMF